VEARTKARGKRDKKDDGGDNKPNEFDSYYYF
jgi:hypothetical protein